MKFEAEIIKFLQAGATDVWTGMFRYISIFGGVFFLISAVLIVFLFNKKYSIAILLTYITSGIFVSIFKAIISRARPFETYIGIQALTDVSDKSMPSGHAMCATLVAVMLAYLICKTNKDKWIKILSCVGLGLFAGLVCISRMYLGVHYLTDIIVGCIIGALFAVIGILIYKKLTKKRENETKDKIE